MTELAKALSKLICVIKVKAGEDGKMFGSVTAGMIADELKHQFDISLDKKKIHLEHPIRALGDHEVELNLHAEVKGTLKVRVESTTPAAAPAPEAAAATAPAEAKAEEGKRPRTEKRGFVRRDARGEKAAKPEKAEKVEAAEAKPKEKKPVERHAKAEKAKNRKKPPRHPRPKRRKRKPSKPPTDNLFSSGRGTSPRLFLSALLRSTLTLRRFPCQRAKKELKLAKNRA